MEYKVKYCQNCGNIMNRRQAGTKFNKRRDSPVICRECYNAGYTFAPSGIIIKRGMNVQA